MGLFDNDTSYNPLFIDDMTGLDADVAEAMLMDDTDEMDREWRKKMGFTDDEEDLYA